MTAFSTWTFLLASLLCKMSAPNVLMVAEKPSVALAIAKIVSEGRVCHKDTHLTHFWRNNTDTSHHTQMTSDKRGCNICSIHEFTAPFLGKPAHYKVTSVVGHVYRFAHHLSFTIFKKHAQTHANTLHCTAPTLRHSTRTGQTLTHLTFSRAQSAKWSPTRRFAPAHSAPHSRERERGSHAGRDT